MSNLYYNSSIFADVKLPKPLSNQEINELFNDFYAGNIQAKEKILLHNIRLVLYIARRFAKNDKELEEFVSTGLIGLINAVNNFDLTKNISFTTYASRCVENEILMFIRKESKVNRNTYSLNQTIFSDKNGNTIKTEDKIYDYSNNVEEILEEKGLFALVCNSANNVLSDIQKKVINLKYSDDTKTTLQIADILNISQSYASKIENEAILAIKKDLIKKGIYIDPKKKIKRKVSSNHCK